MTTISEYVDHSQTKKGEIKINLKGKAKAMYLQANGYQHDISEYAIWIVSIVLIAFGFRYARELIAFVLDKLYQFFIQNLSQ